MCLCSGKYLDFGLRGHNNVCIMAEGEPVPYDPTLIGLSETSAAFTCAGVWRPHACLLSNNHGVFAPVYFILVRYRFIVTMACSAGNSNDLIIFLLALACSLFAGAVCAYWLTALWTNGVLGSLPFRSEKAGLKVLSRKCGAASESSRQFPPGSCKAAPQHRSTMRHDAGGLLSDICPSAGHCKGKNSCLCTLRLYNVYGNKNVLRGRAFYFKLMHLTEMDGVKDDCFIYKARIRLPEALKTLSI